jgi:replicative DNA helicase
MTQNINNGMIAPKAVDLEDGVIGAMIVDSKGVDEVMLIITTPDAFYSPANSAIFKAIQSLHTQGEPIDLLTISAELRKLGLHDVAGGDYALIQLSQKIASSAHIEYHSRIVLQKYIARMIIAFSSKVIGLAHDETTDVFELMERWQKEFDKVVDYTTTGRATMSFPDALEDLKRSVEVLTANPDEVKLVGVDTGFKRLNKYTGGYRNQDLVIVAARPGMGKTSKVLKTAIANVKKGNAVGFISMEMSMHQLTARAVAIDTDFHLKQLIKTGFEKPEYFVTLSGHTNRMKDYPLYIDDSGKTDITDVIITAKLWKRKYNIKLLIIDYIQLMEDRGNKGSRENELSKISRRLKKLAKELDIPVIVLAQVNRECEKRGSSKRPFISDIKDCGSIEQDADIVEFIYRPEYYKIEMDEDDYDVTVQHLIPMGANAEIIFAKYRGGSTGTTLLKWDGSKTKFSDVEDPHDSECETVSNELPKLSPGQAFETDVKDDNDNGIAF